MRHIISSRTKERLNDKERERNVILSFLFNCLKWMWQGNRLYCCKRNGWKKAKKKFAKELFNKYPAGRKLLHSTSFAHHHFSLFKTLNDQTCIMMPYSSTNSQSILFFKEKKVKNKSRRGVPMRNKEAITLLAWRTLYILRLWGIESSKSPSDQQPLYCREWDITTHQTLPPQDLKGWIINHQLLSHEMLNMFESG